MKTVVKLILTFTIAGFLSISLAFGQNGDEGEGAKVKGPKYGADSANCVIHLSLYREFYKQKNYKDALPHWRWVFANCPIASQNTYIDGAKLIQSKIEETTDPSTKNKYIDTLMMVYDQRIQSFGREAYVLGRKGIDMVTYRPDKVEDNYNTLKRAVELGGDNTESSTIAFYFQSVLAMVQQQKLDKSAVVETYDVVSTIIDNNIAKSQDNPKNLGLWGNVKGSVEQAFEPFASCEDLISMYTKKFNQTSDDVNFLIKMTNMLDRKNCTDSDIFFLATEKLHQLQPGAKSAYLMGTMSMKKKQYAKATTYLNQAIELSDNNDDKIKALNVMAAINYEQHNYPQARSNANKILDINPNYGKAYIFIGDLYAASSSMCNEDDLSGKTVFWVAIDMYQKAKSVDPSVADEANGKIAQYSKYFPASTDLFFRDLHDGEPYTVGCWINQNTTIRGIK
ncbi:MAG TPA: hypothetical protein VK172_15135 [Lentimicrobium sp.]|nr:hypothetical protein [Lentimicrobium sp.]